MKRALFVTLLGALACAPKPQAPAEPLSSETANQSRRLKELRYSDGASNLTVIQFLTDHAVLIYDPVTPLESSSGEYSGGEPIHREIPLEAAHQLLIDVTYLSKNASLHTEGRAMMTGAFTLVSTDESKTQFIIRKCPELDALDKQFQELRSKK